MTNNYSHEKISTEVLVVGSGAGGAVTASTLAKGGCSVIVVEEGKNIDTNNLITHTTEAMRLLYRKSGMTPIFGNTSIAYVEGCCVGGSTEINSAFWHRTPEKAIQQWNEKYRVQDLSKENLYKIFDEIEKSVKITYFNSENIPKSSLPLKVGAEKLRWSVREVPRAQISNIQGSQFSAGAKSSMSRTYIPEALKNNAKLLPNCKINKIHYKSGRITHVSGEIKKNGIKQPITIFAEHVFVSSGAVQTAFLLRASGIKKNIGESLNIHPMLKVAALFDKVLDSHNDPLPIYQVDEFWPHITLGGSVFTPGFLAMTLSENWIQNLPVMKMWRNMALYYVACSGKGTGKVRVFPFTGEPFVQYHLSKDDKVNLSKGLGCLSKLLFASGARTIYPSIRGNGGMFSSQEECEKFLLKLIPVSNMSLSNVHAFSTCPMGEDKELCAVNSFGKVHGFDNLYLADASIIPDAPGVNPQGTVMALAMRNAQHFLKGNK